MRKLLAVFAVVLLALGAVSIALAADEGGYSVKGTVVSIDPTGKTIVINTAEGQKTVVYQENTTGLKEVMPGMSVEMTCIDLEGKACATDIKVISIQQSGKPVQTFEGQVVSIDSEGKTVVIKNPKGEQMTIKVVAPTQITKETTVEGKTVSQPMEMKELQPGMPVKVDCLDFEGKFCASKITVVPVQEAGKPVPGATEVTGEVVSIDSEGKSVVVKTVTGEKTIYYQPTTTGPAPTQLEVGKRVKAFCLDIEGKSCIKDIAVEPAPAQ
jgi:arginine repressor